MKEKKKEREGFSSTLGLFLATLGSAVGLGNIWKFPYLLGDNGGAAFLLVYLICVLFVGLPIMVAEFYIGRKTKKNVLGAINELKPKSKFRTIGCFGILSAYLILFFYSSVGGWVYLYVFKAIKGDFKNITPAIASSQFDKVVVGPLSPVIWQIIVIAVVSVILVFGVQKGIEKITKTLMPILFILIILCAVRAITLPGAHKGIEFLFKPDFSKLAGSSILMALGLAFFKLSLGMGTMVTYGSYFTEDTDLIKTAFRVAISDTFVSVLAGLAIFPTVFSFNMEPSSGPGLLFMTIPLVFSKIHFGQLLLVAFFLLSSIAATTAMISMEEVVVAYMVEEKGLSRIKAVIINGIIIIVFGVLAALSASKGSVLSGITILGLSFFDLFDYISSNILLPLGGLLIALFVGYFIKKEDIINHISNDGALNNKSLINMFLLILKYVTPILLLIVLITSLKLF